MYHIIYIHIHVSYHIYIYIIHRRLFTIYELVKFCAGPWVPPSPSWITVGPSSEGRNGGNRSFSWSNNVMRKYGKIMRKCFLWRKYGQIMRKYGTIMGKSWENHETKWEHHGKIWENQWQHMRKHLVKIWINDQMKVLRWKKAGRSKNADFPQL